MKGAGVSVSLWLWQTSNEEAVGKSIRRLAVALGFTLLATSASAADPSYLFVGAGSWATFRDTKRSGEIDIAYRPAYQFWIFKPHAGLLVAFDGDFYGYAGILTDIHLGNRWIVTLSTAVGGYGGHGFDLGSTAEFRSGIDMTYRFENSSRVGVGVYHMSNAGLTNQNPGSESVLLEYFYPLHW